MNIKLLIVFLFAGFISFAQKNNSVNATQKMLAQSEDKLTIGGYAQIDYNQPVNKGRIQNGKLDVHRMVLLFGYNFSKNTQFITEIEMEHVVEIYVEQAWLNHRINHWLNFRGGLMLIPMGIVNEYHEPTTYNGVERPNVDKYIVPTTWREIGAGFNGYIMKAGINYQIYLMNGFSGYNGSAKLNGKNGLRSGRQKGIESIIHTPGLSLKADWNTVPGLKIGASGYFGKTQSSLFSDLDKEDSGAMARADSSVVGISMLGLDMRYRIGQFQFKGQYIVSNLTNTESYNRFTLSDLGSAQQGWYVEGAYNLYTGNNESYKLTPFLRYEEYDTHHNTDASISRNKAYNRNDITFGASLELSRGTVLKADYQIFGNASSDETNGQLNLGIGIWF